MDIVSAALNIDEGKLYAYAASAAKLLPCDGESAARGDLRRLRAELAFLRRFHRTLQLDTAERETNAAEEWLLDNFYLIERESRSAAEELRPLGKLRASGGETLLFALCRSLLRSGGGKLAEERLRVFLDGVQSVCVLRQEELEALGTYLRCALVSAIAEVCRAMKQGRADSERCASLLGALFGGLRRLPSLDFDELGERVNVIGMILALDATGEYARMDAPTKRSYLRRLEQLADRQGVEPQTLARALVERSQREGVHIGALLFDVKGPNRAELYLAAKAALCAALTLLIGYQLGALAAALLLLPLSEAVGNLADCLLSRFVAPRRLPRMDTSRGLPPEGRTVCVISTLLGSEESVRRAARKLELLYHACGGAREKGVLSFGLLADLPVAPSAERESDAPILAAARAEIERLNARCGGGFCLFTRPRRFDGEAYSGFERKRGALCALAALLRGEESELRCDGDFAAAEGARYLLTLDSDTVLYPGAAAQLIGAALHPLNRAVIDPARGTVVRGHGVIAPHVCVSLESAQRTDFAILFAGTGGSDPYGSLGGELSMDAFDAGGFTGKGLLDAEALLRCTAERFAGKGILSHDAPEGAYLRGALLGDEECFDAFPATPAAYFRRLHRWLRGDWQNLRFLFARELRAAERFPFYDKLRRSLVPPAALAALLLGFLRPERLGAAALAAALCLLSELFLALGAELRRPHARRGRRWSRVITGFGGAIVKNFMRLWLLPWESWICLSAAATAFWRMAVSRRRLLEWETAAQSEAGQDGTLVSYAAAMAPVVPVGLAAMCLSAAVIGRAAGLLWLLSPLTAWALSLPAQREKQLSRADEDYLRGCARETWRYFSALSGEEEHGLPPDNFQTAPARGAAHSVSPTNLGLAMAAACAACDLGVIGEAEALGYLRRALGTAERLPRFRGHFYNWYDTRTLEVLQPPTVSTVDSGNCCVSLYAAARFAEEKGDAPLARRLRTLAEEMDFSFLYDETRALFVICYDTLRQRGAGGWYDLMESEALLTSYLAVARGDAPRRHWRALGRSMLGKDGYRALASWTGTMFEYLMSPLFLPLQKGSLLDESARFCLWAQKRRVPPLQPWGISESAFFSLDAAGRYRYKAHGVGALALRRGMDAETVISPYSSFLALALAPHEAVVNLRRLERRGLRGPYGFFEALDCTPGRIGSPEGEVVRTTMAHHAAMSLCAMANALCGGSVAGRFMADARMEACLPLLCERLDEGGAVLRRDKSGEAQPPRTAPPTLWRGEKGEKGSVLLSNGSYTVELDERGEQSARYGELCVSDARFGGVHIRLRRRGEETQLMPSLCCRWEMGADYCRYEYETPQGRAALCVSVGAEDCGTLYELELPALAPETAVLLDFVPLLAPLRDMADHPAYERLGIRAEQRDGALLLRRIARQGWGDLYLAARCSRTMEAQAESGGGGAVLLRPQLMLRAKTDGEHGALRFALCLSTDAAEALEGARRLLASTQRGAFPRGAAALLGLRPEEQREAMALAARLRAFRPRLAAPKSALWAWGVSGDAPLLLCPGGAREEQTLLRQFCLLRSCGVEAELALLTDETGEYAQPTRERTLETLSRLGLEALLGARLGVHLCPAGAEETLMGRAAHRVGTSAAQREPLPRPRARGRSRALSPEGDFDGEGGFSFLLPGALPRKPWQHILFAAGSGWLVSECGSGFLWSQNAREGRFNPPPTLPESSFGSEALWAATPRGEVSLFAAADGIACRVSYSAAFARWEKEIDGRAVTLTGFLDPESGARVLLIDGAEGLTLCWRMELVLGSQDGACVSERCEGALLRAENPESFVPDLRFFACAGEGARCRCDWAEPGFLFSLRAREHEILCCGAAGESVIRALCERKAALSACAAALRTEQERLALFSLRCSDKALERYLNGWCLTQVYSRLEARTSLYQSGGAIGFRDQLQDAVNILLVDGTSARERILDACRHQYREGDVMHWWHAHPAGDRGVRTRCSDDLLWLCWALGEYVAATGEKTLLDERTPFLDSPPLFERERDRYETPPRSDEEASVLDHAVRAIACCTERGFGPHGLPLMLAGDWNDSLGDCGGESVWLGFFLCACARSVAALLRLRGRGGEAERCDTLARDLLAAAEKSFNGRWYERVFPAHGDFTRGGTRIDSIVQSWAVFCGAAHAREALDHALCRLVDAKTGTVKLLDPPFAADEERFGTITAYGEGVRENGGQYTHAAIWLARACFLAGRPDAGREILSLLLPSGRGAAYGGEPYVLAADVCTAPGHEGEALWTWYTGSAGWYFRTATENLLGIRKENGQVRIEPPACALFEVEELRFAGAEGGKNCSAGLHKRES